MTFFVIFASQPHDQVNYFMSLTILSHVPPSCDQCHAPVHFDIGIRVSFNYICYHRGLYTELLYAMVFSLGYRSGLVIPQFSVGLV